MTCIICIPTQPSEISIKIWKTLIPIDPHKSFWSIKYAIQFGDLVYIVLSVAEYLTCFASIELFSCTLEFHWYIEIGNVSDNNI